MFGCFFRKNKNKCKLNRKTIDMVIRKQKSDSMNQITSIDEKLCCKQAQVNKYHSIHHQKSFMSCELYSLTEEIESLRDENLNLSKVMKKLKKQQNISTLIKTMEIRQQISSNLIQKSNSHLNKVNMITLSNLKKQIIEEQKQLEQDYDIAENSFKCDNINQQFSKALLQRKVNLAEELFNKMNPIQRNTVDKKGYTPFYLTLLLALQQQQYCYLVKNILYLLDFDITEKGPQGWNPLQQAIFYKNIPLTTQIFQFTYKHNKSMIKKKMIQFEKFLSNLQDFTLCLDIRVDSSIPLLGKFTPGDLITLTKYKNKVRMDYSLVSYQYLCCKRRQMSCLFDGDYFYIVNHNKNTYTDLLEDLDSQEMVLIIQDLLSIQTIKMDPIIKQSTLKQNYTLLNKEIIQQYSNISCVKYTLDIVYDSTTEKKMPSCQKQQKLFYLDNWYQYQQYKWNRTIKQKNQNKSFSLDLWLAENYILNLENLLKICQIFSIANNSIQIIYKFIKHLLMKQMKIKSKFPIKIQVPLNYSLYFDIQFKNISFQSPSIDLFKINSSYQQISRKQYHKTTENIQKRYLLRKLYT